MELPVKCLFLAEEEPGAPGKREHYIEIDANGQEVPEIDIGQDQWPHKWEKKILTYKIRTQEDETEINKFVQDRALTVALRIIGLRCKLKFKRVYGDGPADINVDFTKDLTVFDNRQSVLAQAYLVHPRNPPGKNGLLQFNANYFWTVYGQAVEAYLIDPVHYYKGEKTLQGHLKMLASQPLLHVLIHELLHCLGFRHDKIEELSMLWPFAKKGTLWKTDKHGNRIQVVNRDAFVLHEKDIYRLILAYGYRGISGRILTYFLNRRLNKVDFR